MTTAAAPCLDMPVAAALSSNCSVLQAFLYERAQTFTDLPSIYRRRPIDDIDIAEVGDAGSKFKQGLLQQPETVTARCS